MDAECLAYDGKKFGLGALEVEVPQYHGEKRITSLDRYPLQYHKDADELRPELLERGKKFVLLEGMNYRG